jgi:hypothetical protein
LLLELLGSFGKLVNKAFEELGCGLDVTVLLGYFLLLPLDRPLGYLVDVFYIVLEFFKDYAFVEHFAN